MNMWKERDLKEDAIIELTKYEALLHLVANNMMACHIECAGFSLGVVNNRTVIPAIEDTINEIKKAINGEPNEWE